MIFMVDVILPLFLMIAAGFLLGKFRKMDTRTIASLNMFVLLPCLIFSSMIKKGTPSVLLIILFVVVVTFLLYAISLFTGRLFPFDKTERSAFHLSNCFLNAGNYGVPFCLLAFGEEGMNIALIFVIGSHLHRLAEQARGRRGSQKHFQNAPHLCVSFGDCGQ